MISVIITAKDEQNTIKKAVEAFLDQKYDSDFEIIVVAPDEETLGVVRGMKNVITLRDEDIGKATALNLAIKRAEGEKFVFSDGDIEVTNGAIQELLAIEADMVSGRPVAMPKNIKQENKFDFWQRFLFDQADKMRREKNKEKSFLVISGYLFMAKREVFEGFKFPEGLLTEDEYISYFAYNRGFKLGYARDAHVRVRFPQNVKDFVRQKVRTLGGSYQIPKCWKEGVMRSFGSEVGQGFIQSFKYIKNLKQLWWMNQLFILRLYAWVLAFIKVKAFRLSVEKIWKRVESTK